MNREKEGDRTERESKREVDGVRERKRERERERESYFCLSSFL